MSIAVASTPKVTIFNSVGATGYKVLRADGTLVNGAGAISSAGSKRTITLTATDTASPGPMTILLNTGAGWSQGPTYYVSGLAVGTGVAVGQLTGGMAPDAYTVNKADGTTSVGTGAITTTALGGSTFWQIALSNAELSVNGPLTVIATNLGAFVGEVDIDAVQSSGGGAGSVDTVITKDVNGNVLSTSPAFGTMVPADILTLIGNLRSSQTLRITITDAPNPDTNTRVNPCGGE